MIKILKHQIKEQKNKLVDAENKIKWSKWKTKK